MSSEASFHQIKSLQKKILELTRKIESLQAFQSAEALLRMRGFKVFQRDPDDRLFFPPRISRVRMTRFFEMMKKYSFRLVLRDMIKHSGEFEARTSPTTVPRRWHGNTATFSGGWGFSGKVGQTIMDPVLLPFQLRSHAGMVCR